MGEWRDSTSPWPKHQRDYWRTALSEARAKGWWLRVDAGHNFGLAACAPPGVADRCTFPIYSTGRGSESAAKTFEGQVRGCPHHVGTSVLVELEGQVLAAESALRGATRLVDAAEGLIQADADDAHAYGLLEDAEREVDGAREVLEAKAVEMAARADQDRKRARTAAFTEGVADPSPMPLLDEARSRLVDAVAPLPAEELSLPSATEVLAAIEALLSRIATLRSQIVTQSD